MSNPYPTMNVGSDTGALNVEGNQLLGAGAGVAIGLFIGKGKLIPAALGAGLGYLLSHTELFKKLTGKLGPESQLVSLLAKESLFPQPWSRPWLSPLAYGAFQKAHGQ